MGELLGGPWSRQSLLRGDAEQLAGECRNHAVVVHFGGIRKLGDYRVAKVGTCLGIYVSSRAQSSISN